MAEATEHLRIVISAQDQASQVIRGMSQEMNSFVSNVARGVGTGIGFAAFNQAAQALGQAFHFASDAVIGFNSSMEQSRIGWTTMLGSAEQAQAMLQQLQQFAAQTPFSFPQVEQAARRFAAMGIAAGNIVPLIRSVGEAAAAVGGGEDAVNRISLALGQMSTRTKVSAQDMLQLTEVGVPAWRILAEATGQSVAQVMDSTEKGQISADTMITAFQRFADVHWKDLLDPDTFQAIVSNIGDSATYLISQAFEPTFQGLKDLAKAFQDFISSAGVRDFAALMRSIQVATRDFLTGVSQSGPILQVLEAAVLAVAAAIAVALVPALIAAAVAAAPWLALGAALTAVALVILQNWDAISQGTQEFAENFRQALGQVVQFANFLSGALTEGLNNLATEWTTGWAAIANGFAAPINFITNAWADFWNNSINKTGEDGFNALIAMADRGWGEFARKSVEELRFVATAWNTLVSDLQALKDVGVPLPQDLDLLAGKTIDIDKGLQSVQQGIQNVSSGAVQAGQSIGQFVAQDIPAAVAKAVETVMAAGGDLGQLIPALIKQIQDRVGGGGGGDAPALKAGQAIGTSLGQGILQGVKPLLEELARLIAQQAAGPATAALEDTQKTIERDRLLLQVRGLPSEERIQARRDIRGLTRNVLPGQELAAFDVNEAVRLTQRAETVANLRNQILQTQLKLAGGTGGISSGLAATGGAPPAVAPSAIAPTAAPSPITIPLQVNIIQEGSVVQTFEELLEANQQAQIPPVVIQSAMRRN